jgi:hypothetical protein
MTIAVMLATALLGAAQDTTPPPQGVDYRIEAALDERTDVLRGRARLRYANRSGVALDTLWFHQHLNAFRPASAWARREAEYGQRRFQDLGPDNHAFERLTAVRVDGAPARPVYPGAPDSTVVGIPLPETLLSGDSVIVVLDWEARLSTVARRQGRQGRHYDWAQWYPRIAVFEKGAWQTQPLMPQGEFYGEFGAFDVTLEVAADQVLGATGVPVEGDPGWQAAAVAGTGEIRYGREAYPAKEAETLGLLSGPAAEGRKRVRWRAEDVHHFAWSANPAFLYEQGTVERRGEAGDEIAIHVLYLPADTSWDDGVALRRTQAALRWLQDLWGPYLWPQLTNLHRIEPGGTEFPMLLMDGSASEGLILHETGHQYVHGMLANNEWREGWLDEGFQSFVDDWAQEEAGVAGVWEPSLQAIRQLEAAGRAQPIATQSADFADPAVYSMMTYVKPALVLRMLRDLVGGEVMREILREYFRRHALGHVEEADFRAVVNDVSGADYDWFFDQWLHTTARLDYAVAGARTAQAADGRWRTEVTVRREGEAWMPVTVQVGSERVELRGRAREQVVEVTTAGRPTEVVVDPERKLLEADVGNNRRGI